jgi:hypothetical protein
MLSKKLSPFDKKTFFFFLASKIVNGLKLYFEMSLKMTFIYIYISTQSQTSHPFLSA